MKSAKTNLRITDGLNVVREENQNHIHLSVIHDGEEKVLLDSEKEDCYFTIRYDGNYIIVGRNYRNYHKNKHTFVEAAYNVKEKRLLDLENNKELNDKINYIYAIKKGFYLTTVLDFLNNQTLGITKQEEIEKLKSYLTCENETITLEEIKNFILKNYPKLEEYINLSSPFTIIDCRNLAEKLGFYQIELHTMHQIVDEEKDKKVVRQRAK